MLSLTNVVKTYEGKGTPNVVALKGISIDFPDKGLVFLLGKSGSGKSTLLNIIGGLDSFNIGELSICGKSSKDFSKSDFDSYRNTFVGFIFQECNLLDELSIKDNIALALELQGKPFDENLVNDILEKVDLKDLGDRMPNTLSGGQKQRIAIARALIKDPKIIMADEPTGALDSSNGAQIFSLLKELSKEKLIIVVSHDREYAEIYGDRIIELADGEVISDITRDDKNFSNIEVEGNKVFISNINSINEKDVKKIINAVRTNDGNITLEKRERIVEEKVKEKQKERAKYNDIQLLKSKLPLKNVLKMGVGGLISKPVRLIFTVVLTVIAFALFGVLSALMMYNSYYSVSEALTEKGYNNALISKSYQYDQIVYDVVDSGENYTLAERENESYLANGLFSQTEIEELNQKNTDNLKFAGVFDFSTPKTYKQIDGDDFVAEEKVLYQIENCSVGAEFYLYYTKNDLLGIDNRKFQGFSDCGEQFLIDSGFQKLAGRYPENYDEIAISEYMFNMLCDSDSIAVSSLDDIENGYEISLKYQALKFKVKVVGVYRITNLDKYSCIRGSIYKTVDEDVRESLSSELLYLTEGLDTVGFVSDDFYDHYYHYMYTYLSNPEDLCGKGIAFKDFEDSGEKVKPSTMQIVYTKNSVGTDISRFSFYNIETLDQSVDLSKDGVYKHITKDIELLDENGNYIYNKYGEKMTNTSFNTIFQWYATSYDQPNWKENLKRQISNKDIIVVDDNNIYYKVSEYEEEEDYIYLPYNEYVSLRNEYGLDAILNDYFLIKDKNDNITEVKVKGFYLCTGECHQYVFMADSLLYKVATVDDATIKVNTTSYVSDDNGKYNYITSAIDGGIGQCRFILRDRGTYHFEIKNEDYRKLYDDGAISVINNVKNIFTVVAIIIGIFAALMLFNFISASITAKKKEIGILRALGAGGKDVLKIFLSEALILSIICFILATVLSYFSSFILSDVLYGYVKIRIVKMRFVNVLIMFGVSFIISLIGTFFPVYKESKKSPSVGIREL